MTLHSPIQSQPANDRMAFKMPRCGDSLGAFEMAARLLNIVAPTAAQIAQGYQIYVRATDWQAPNGDRALAALEAFARAEGLAPVDIAARAILTRGFMLADAAADGVDLKAEAPGVYRAILEGDLTAADLGYFPPLESAQPEG